VAIGLPYYAFARTGHALRIAFPGAAWIEFRVCGRQHRVQRRVRVYKIEGGQRGVFRSRRGHLGRSDFSAQNFYFLFEGEKREKRARRVSVQQGVRSHFYDLRASPGGSFKA
jgi:hypothetical protein